MASFWTGLYRNAAAVDTISLPNMITYALLSATLGGLSGVFGLLQIHLTYSVSAQVRTGEVAALLVKPVDFQASLLAYSLGRAGYNALFSLPVFALALLVFGLELPPSINTLWFFLVSVCASFGLTFLVDFIVATSSFWTTQSRGLGGLTRLVIAIFSGGFVPLWLFPDWAERTLTYLPFASIFSAPLSIYVGRVRGGDILTSLAVQGVWLLVLAAFSRWLWSVAQRRYHANGG
jgi:ABC-2 type transport system permease protein